MSVYRRIGFAGAMFVIAVAAGFVMQNRDALAKRFGGAKATSAAIGQQVPQPNIALMRPGTEQTDVILSQAKDSAIGARNAAPLALATHPSNLSGQAMQPKIFRVAALENPPFAGAAMPALGGQAARVPSGDGTATAGTCSASLSAVVEAAAMVHLYLDAPCNTNAGVVIKQGDLAFTAQTDKDGLLDITVPALQSVTKFRVSFANNVSAEAQVTVPEAGKFQRVALLWQGKGGLQIHAREFGANYGDAGHVWTGTPRTSIFALRAMGGFLTSLGDAAAINPQFAEIYTFPTGTTRNSGTVRLSVEAEITPANCGRDVKGMSLQSTPDGTLTKTRLILSIPNCDTVGDFLVLNSLLRDLKVAGN